ncbi:MAG: PKD domain-containing protein [Candidatus Thermoplasmatota archaeon]|nr:PKD domain-containing protein [Candidatus Thermoplasmatota archaeon]
MAKRIAAAILLCAVMVMIAAAPLATADTHHVVKGAQGPRASAVTWEYVPADYGTWTGQIKNTGLRSLVVDVYDNITGALESIMHQRIRFAAYDAFPSGDVTTAGAVMNPTHKYVITVTPNGPKTTFCDVVDVFVPASPPEAVISVTPDYLTVTVDGSGSSDDGMIMSYEWAFGDGGTATGVIATHTYAADGTYTITLTVTDNDGLTGTASTSVSVVAPPDDPPVAFFTWTVSGLTVDVDATLSTDDNGIVSYEWNWGDGTPDGSGMITSHTYVQQAPPAPAPGAVALAPGPPYLLWGYTLDALGNPVECYVTITNTRTGEIGYTDSFQVIPWPLDGYYEFDLQNSLPSAFLPGDQINVDVVSVSGTMTGSNQKVVSTPPGGSMNIDVTVTGGVVHFDRTITLTVTDTKGQTATYSVTVTLPVP